MYRGIDWQFPDETSHEETPSTSYAYDGLKDFVCPPIQITRKHLFASADTGDTRTDAAGAATNEAEETNATDTPTQKMRRAGASVRVGRFQKLLWRCAGADTDVLAICPADHPTYTIMGALLLLIALSAAFSMGYAIHLIVKNASWYAYIIDIVIGLIWAAVILCINALAIINMGGTNKARDAKWLINILFRIILSVTLGIIISAPIELFIFDSNINEKLDVMLYDKINNSNELDRYKHQMDSIQIKIVSLNETLHNNNLIIKENERIENEILKLQNDRDQEIKKECSKLRPPKQDDDNFDTSYYTYSSRIKKVTNEITERYNVSINKLKNDKKKELYTTAIQEQIDNLNAENDTLASKLKKTESDIEKNFDKENIINQLTALHRLIQKPEIVILAITLFFIVLDILPLLMKMMGRDKVYTAVYERIAKEERDELMDKLEKPAAEPEVVCADAPEGPADEIEKTNEELFNEVLQTKIRVIRKAYKNWESQMNKVIDDSHPNQ